MWKTEKKEVLTYKEKVVAVVCDVCGKEHKGDEIPGDWHFFNATHQECENDSVFSNNSYEEFIVCSGKCFFEKASYLVEKNLNFRSFMIDDMRIDFLKNLIDFVKK
jgi:hypothetical protein